MLPPSATTENTNSDSAKINRIGIGGASKSVESFLEAVPPVTNGTLLGGGGDELSIGCVKEIGLRIKCTLSRYKLFFYRGSTLSRSAVGSANSTGSLLNTSAIRQ